jgi:two-component system, NarL family, invasion response regulator UvrY
MAIDGRNGRIGVLIVDDHDAFRIALRELIDACGEFALLGEVTAGEAAIEAVEELAPQLVIMDLRMAGIGGLEAMRRLAGRRPDVAVLLVSLDAPREGALDDWPTATFMRKQALNPRTLRAAWREHAAARPTAC